VGISASAAICLIVMSLNDQPGECCNGMSSSVGSEFVVSHWIARIQFSTPSLEVEAFVTWQLSVFVDNET
jgi:hypothetical protein